MKKKIILDISICILIVVLGVVLRCVGNGTEVIPDELKTSFTDESGTPYLSDTDSYFYLRYAEEIADGNVTHNFNRETDPLMNTSYKLTEDSKGDSAKVGMSYMGAMAITVARWFGYNNSVAVCTFLGMLLGSLAAVPAYIFIRRRTNTWGAIAGSVSASLAISFICHTIIGFFDTDSILAVFPLTMMCCFAESLFADKTWKSYVWNVCGILAFAVIAVSWGSYTGYYFIMFGVCLVLLVCTLIWPHLFPRKNIKPLLITFLGITLIAFIVSGSGLISRIIGILNQYSGNGSAGTSNGGQVFPSATLFTSELSDIDWISGGIKGTFNVSNYGIINRLGGFGLVSAVLFIMAIGYFLVALATRRGKEKQYSLAESENQRRKSIIIRQEESAKRKRKIELTHSLRSEWAVELAIFGTWLLGTLIMLSRGVRFIELPALPLAIVFGLGIGYLTKSIKENNIDKLLAQFLYMACAVIICGSLVQLDAFWAQIVGVIVLIFGILIRNKTNIILTFLLTASMLISPVLGTITIAKGSLPTVSDAFADAAKWLKDNTDEKASVGTWWDYGYYFEEAAQRRFLADGGTTNGEIFYYLASALMTSDPKECAEKLRMMANYKGNDEDELYLLISRDMLEKLGAIGYYGTWDFEKLEGTSAYFYSTLYSAEVNPGQSVSVALPTLDGYGINYTVSDEGALSVCFISEGGAVQDICRLMVVQDGKIVYDEPVEHEYEAAPGLIVMREGNRYSAALTSPQAMDSMIVKLYVSNGSFSDVFERVNVSTLSEEATTEPSEIQRLLGNYFINASATTGVVIYKINQ